MCVGALGERRQPISLVVSRWPILPARALPHPRASTGPPDRLEAAVGADTFRGAPPPRLPSPV